MILKQENVHSGLATDVNVHNRKLDLKPAFEAGFIFLCPLKRSVYSFILKTCLNFYFSEKQNRKSQIMQTHPCNI
jgi:hypothetical protein